MEPLCVGDIIRYNPPFDLGNTGKEREGTVANIDKSERQINTLNIDVLDRMGVIRRIGSYNHTDGSNK